MTTMSSTPLVFSTAYSGRVRCGTARRPRPAAAVPRNAPHTARAAPPPRAERIAGPAHRDMGTATNMINANPMSATNPRHEPKGSGPPHPDSPTRWDPAPFRRTAPPAPPGDGAAPAAPAGDAGSLANAITAGVAKSIRRLPARGPRPPPPTCIGAPTGSATWRPVPSLSMTWCRRRPDRSRAPRVNVVHGNTQINRSRPTGDAARPSLSGLRHPITVAVDHLRCRARG